jgi:glycogen synthase
MRICSLTNAYLPHAGGIEVLLDATCAPLRSGGHELLIVTGDGGTPPPSAISDDEWLRPTPGVHLERLQVHEPVSNRDVRGIHRLTKQLRRILDEFQPDVVHAHDVGPLLWLYQRVAGAPASWPLIVTLHTLITRYDEVTAGAVHATGGLLQRADVVTGVSRHVVDDIIGYAPEVADRVVHLPNGIVAPTVPRTTVDRQQVIAIGRLVPFKAHELAIDAFATVRARHPGARLDIAGEGPSFAALTAHTRTAGLDDAVTFLGRRSHDEVLARLAASTCLLMSSHFEGLPLVALEAAWLGRPVVAFDTPGVDEAVVHGETGVLVAPGDVRALGDAVADLIDDPERADRLGANGRARAAREYGIDRYVRDLLELYERTIAAHRARSTAEGAPA